MNEKKDISYGYAFIVLGFIYGTYHAIQSFSNSISIVNKVLTLLIDIIIYGVLAAVISVGTVSIYRVYTKDLTDRKALLIALILCIVIGLLFVFI